MKNFQLALGDKIELLPMLPDGSCSTTSFASQIQEVLSENDFLILPLDRDHPANWIGRSFKLLVIRKNIIFVNIVVIKRPIRENGILFLHLITLEPYRATQRRLFYRLKVYLEIEVSEYGKYKTVDLSGSGLAFISDQKIPRGERIDITIFLREEKLDVSGVVLRSIDVSRDADKSRFQTSIEFTAIDKNIQNAILRYIYAQQRIMIKNGILTSQTN